MTQPAGLPGNTVSLLDDDSAQRVSDALRRSSYTVDGCAELTAGGLDGSPLSLLIRLFLRGESLPAADVFTVLPEAAAPLLCVDGGAVTAAYDVSPYGDETHDWYVVSDRVGADGRPVRRDHVLGVGGASMTLAQLTVRRPVARALDVGTGSGMQALHLSTHCERVVATDAVPRALQLAATTAALSGVAVELVEGDLCEPVADREFDLVVCNPPFVISPSARFDYRDGAGCQALSRPEPAESLTSPGDDFSRRAVRSCASVLADGGVAQLLVNWLHSRGEDWRDRVAAWVSDLGVDAWLIERDVQEPADYVRTWAADAGEQDDAGVTGPWLDWFGQNCVEAVGFGWVVLRRSSAPHRVAVEPITHPVDQPLGAAVGGWLDRTDWLRAVGDEDLLATRFTVTSAARLDTASRVGALGWEQIGAALRLDEGFRWTLPTDEATAALVAGCDGTAPLHRLVDVLGLSLGVPVCDLSPAVCSTVRGLVDRGLLLPS